MFKIYITETTLKSIILSEEMKPMHERSYLYKLLKQQQVLSLTVAETERLKSHPEEVQKNPSALYILDISPSEALGIQRS